MALKDSVAGATRPPRLITWYRPNGTVEDLTGATITGVITTKSTGSSRAIVGTTVVSDAPNGKFTWTFDSADVVEGEYEVQFTASFGAGSTPARTFATDWSVKKAL